MQILRIVMPYLLQLFNETLEWHVGTMYVRYTTDCYRDMAYLVIKLFEPSRYILLIRARLTLIN